MYPLNLLDIRDPRVWVFTSRAHFEENTGEVCPPYDPKQPPKLWRWIGEVPEDEDFMVVNVLATDKQCAYISGPDGKPYMRSRTLPVNLALTVNIPPPTSLTVGAPPAIPMPVRKLTDGEYLAWGAGPMAGPVVKNHASDDQEPAVFTQRHAKILEALAAKEGV